VANRLQAALYREVVHLIDQDVVSVWRTPMLQSAWARACAGL
jgi:hypothetical protein